LSATERLVSEMAISLSDVVAARERLKGAIYYTPCAHSQVLSALTGQRVRKLLDLIGEVAEQREKRIPTAEVNKVLGELVDRVSPPQKAGDEVKLLYASQIGTAPPEFAIVSNRPLDIHESYLRYLSNGFRAAWGFKGSPLRIKFTSRGSRR